PGTAGESAPHLGRGAHRQAGLADPARPDERDQPSLAEPRPYLRQLVAASDEAGRLGRQVAGAAGRSGHGSYLITHFIDPGARSRPRTVKAMTGKPRVQRVEVSFVGAPPVARIARASGVSAVQIDGSVVRCLVYGSFQPFLEALHGYEVASLQSVSTE